MSFNPLMHNVPKWSDTLKILQHLLQDIKSVSDHFGTLCIKGLMTFFKKRSRMYQQTSNL